jgi:hypothetical protein
MATNVERMGRFSDVLVTLQRKTHRVAGKRICGRRGG